jgi:hypothetical protein
VGHAPTSATNLPTWTYPLTLVVPIAMLAGQPTASTASTASSSPSLFVCELIGAAAETSAPAHNPAGREREYGGGTGPVCQSSG